MYKYEMMLANNFKQTILSYDLPITVGSIDRVVDSNLRTIIENLDKLIAMKNIKDWDEDLKEIRHNVYEAIDNIFNDVVHSFYSDLYAGLYICILTLADELFLEPLDEC